MSVEELQTSLQNLITKDFNLSNLEKLLTPIPFYTGNHLFDSRFSEILKIVTQDRDADKKFTVNDLILFSKDIVAMTTFITSLLLILNSIPNVKITYTEGETEQLIFKLIVYIFLVIVPQYTNIKFTIEERHAVLNVCILVYLSLNETKLLKKVVNKVASWFKKAWINCFKNESVIDQKMPQLHQQLDNTIKK